jgi:hypothetical protein
VTAQLGLLSTQRDTSGKHVATSLYPAAMSMPPSFTGSQDVCRVLSGDCNRASWTCSDTTRRREKSRKAQTTTGSRHGLTFPRYRSDFESLLLLHTKPLSVVQYEFAELASNCRYLVVAFPLYYFSQALPVRRCLCDDTCSSMEKTHRIRLNTDL